ncbi:MAG: ABC transporter ATP-binding protein, partial [Clostridia bacterium]|nr:ABC transporter ATP-binding protein [Clostridia bacterium]
LDEPLNGLDADGMRIMREVFTDIIKDGKRSIVVSSHLLGELQKVATHYGIIRHGKMIVEMTAEELEASCRTYVALRSAEMDRTKRLLGYQYSRVEEDEAGYIRVYDAATPEEVVSYLYENRICVTELKCDKIGLEEYYMDLMKGGTR